MPYRRSKKTAGKRQEPTLGVHFWEASRLIDDVSVNKYATKERGQYKEPKRELFPARPTQNIPIEGKMGPSCPLE